MTPQRGHGRSAAADAPDGSHQLLSAVGDGLVLLNETGEIVVWSAAAERVLDRRASEVIGRRFVDLGLADLSELASTVIHGNKDDGHLERRLAIPRGDDDPISVLVQVVRMGSADDPVGAVVAISDLGARLRVDRVRRAAEMRLAMLVHYSADIVALIDAAGTIQFVGAASAQRYGYSAEELLGHGALDFVNADDQPRLRAAFATASATDGGTCDVIFRWRSKTGTDRWMEGRAINLLAHPSVEAMLISVHDVTERVAVEAQLAHQATHDVLTGLPNRALFVDRLRHHVEHARRHGLTVAVLFWDVNDFKMVNDLGGHAVGDFVLVEMSKHALLAMRSEDSVARLGGDEFVACAEVENSSQARALALRLSAQLPVDVTLGNGRHLRVAPSLGVAYGTGVPADRLLHEADRAMYDAKNEGGEHAVVRRVLPNRAPQ